MLGFLMLLFTGCSQNESTNNKLTGEKPPSTFVSIGNQVEEMILGSYCWTNTCVDTAGTVELLALEGKIPVKIEGGETIRFEMDYEVTPNEITLVQVSEEGEVMDEVDLTNDSFIAPTENGIYYYSYSVAWRDTEDSNVSLGDAFYAFALEVGNEAEVTFTGIIVEIHGQTAVVKVEEGEILKSADRISVNLSVNSEERFEIGDKVRVGYEGAVRESYPAGVDEVYVELLTR